MRLLGETRINEILANVIHPMLVSCHQADWESYKKIRAELSNRRLAIVCRRLFGEIERAREHVRFLYQQQGLLQEDGHLVVRVWCKEDAGINEGELFRYGIAITIEAETELPVYEEIRARLRVRAQAEI
jgi:hypothetical protein